MTPEITVFDSLEAASHEAARCLIVAAREAVICTGRAAVALSGGHTPTRLYELLASEEYRAAVPWDEIDWFWSDERAVPPDSPQSNFRLADEIMLSHVPVSPSRIFRMPADAADLDRAARSYEALVRERVPDLAFDLMLLGVGGDGHTASLFPGHPALEETERLVIPVEGDPSLEVRWRMTFTFPLINLSRTVLVLADSASKASIIDAVRKGGEAAAQYPVSRVRPAGHLTWLVGEQAG
ncbi:MAG TPA: 6-phosphogluconolactonase, partial [Gemmatimonadales bacterium]|nr:6-phosphogluconolactonase [Gemmatimonadales bacterium]